MMAAKKPGYITSLKTELNTKRQELKSLTYRLQSQSDSIGVKATHVKLKKRSKTKRAITQLTTEICRLKKRIGTAKSSQRQARSKCTLCGEIIRADKRTDHLLLKHNICEYGKGLCPFFVHPTTPISPKSTNYIHRGERAKSTVENGPVCGAVVNGAPKLRIIFNAIETGRRKH